MVVKKKMEENPVFASVGVIVLAASVLTAFGTITGFYNSSHTTEAELKASHPVSKMMYEDIEDKMDENAVLSKCRWLKSEIRALSDSIYVRKRDGADPDFIHTLEADLEDLEEQYVSFNCTRRLS